MLAGILIMQKPCFIEDFDYYFDRVRIFRNFNAIRPPEKTLRLLWGRKKR